MVIVCSNCGIRIEWRPTLLGSEPFCCVGCAMGGPCNCDYSNLPRENECRTIVVVNKVELASGAECADVLSEPSDRVAVENRQTARSSKTGRVIGHCEEE